MSSRTRRVFLWGAILAVAAAVLAGFILLESPAEARQRELDSQRIRDLDRLSGMARVYWQRHERLPETLDALSAEPGLNVPLRDPDGQPYEYRTLGQARYEVCARFARASPERRTDHWEGRWSHGAGRQCFPRSVQKPAD